jgi:hypothetical protein
MKIELYGGPNRTGGYSYTILDVTDPDKPDGIWLGDLNVSDRDLAIKIAEDNGWEVAE